MSSSSKKTCQYKIMVLFHLNVSAKLIHLNYVSFFIIIIQHWLETDIKTDISELSHRDHVRFCEMHIQREEKRKPQRGGGRLQGGVCLQMMSEWKRKFLHIHEKQRQRAWQTAGEKLTYSTEATVSAFYSIWTCIISVGSRVCESAEAQSGGNLLRSDAETCVLWLQLCAWARTALVLSFSFSALLIWILTSAWNDGAVKHT